MQKLKIFLKEQFDNFAPAMTIALGVALFSIIAANLFYHQKPMLKRGFEVEIGKTVVKKAEKPIDLAALMKLADAKRGAKIFKKCASCHNVEKNSGNKVGPNLFGIVGNARASISGFAYSNAMKAKGGSWDRDSIDQFIAKPQDFISGTKMAFPGLKKPQDRADVILFLEKQK
ncbi:MAG: hypothetical protein A2887_06510 [Alphaproteobacteria bacterium RIFCSPLOWO2_01_FULL_40_26]|nr:MAG: hypothetical protein A3D15_01095 [Alphaproteobacteria bacterium RIFCSPHIGHO2_02_FULL_40_34]OFW86588.1 MAG: hypothetical protein A2794_02325 [Alphaproteobacteria bacterium RIFCSPHIGHO2_01_FULL_40_8]OFW94072.1 MAG: hypothetical protein A2887_06510 [Alphaproteobacteria bacterium RIFCSPLOWO2_01_FULL_40_26]OFX09596.1 MAG: hypothetical protein A3H30_00080 [Alphaproteobacteria bacterium RIFCSPLOWO2_02_FULL_40_19]OFX11257.1 MAG: hypothetical protein A3G22_00665 [Alphaproteobacteria bacterium RI